jgi:hypothetical protein
MAGQILNTAVLRLGNIYRRSIVFHTTVRMRGTLNGSVSFALAVAANPLRMLLHAALARITATY